MKNRYRSNKNKSKFRNSGSGSNLPAYLILFATLILISVGSFLYFKAETDLSTIGDDYCRKDQNSAITVILIDHTDKMNPIQRAALERMLWKIAKATPKNSLLEVFSVGRMTDKPLEPVFHGCNPGDADSVSEVIGNKTIAARKYKKWFMEPLQNELGKIVDGNAGTQSPIMESVLSISVTSFLEDKNANAEKTLILVSDLLQHSDGFSVYKGIPDFKSFRMSPYGKSITADLTGVNVQILFVNRVKSSSLQNSDLRKFWREYFNNQRARLRHEIAVGG